MNERPRKEDRQPAGGWRIRPFRPEDAERVKAITTEGFAPVSIEAAIERRWPGVLPAPWGERKWRSMQPEIAGHPEGCFVVEAAGEVVGYVTTGIIPEHKVGRVADLAVDTRWQGQGLGRALIEHALDYLRAQGIRLARIETLEHNEVGRHLYPSMGFQEVARQVYYALPLVDPPEGESGD